VGLGKTRRLSARVSARWTVRSDGLWRGRQRCCRLSCRRRWSQLKWRWSSSASPRPPAQRLDGTVDPEPLSNTDDADLLEGPGLKLEQDVAAQIVCAEDIGVVGTLAGREPPSCVLVGPARKLFWTFPSRCRGKRGVLASDH